MFKNIKTQELSAAIFLSVISFSLAYHWQVLNPSNIDWLMNRNDRAMSYLGWLFFKNSHWTLPLGRIADYFYPVGSTVSFTDSLPLFAYVFKPFVGGNSGDFQYFGLWLLVCYVLQGIFACLISTEISKNRWYRILSTGFFALSPILLQRRGYLTLNSHWLILASLYLYLKRDSSPTRNAVYYGILALLGALIHPYITVMIFAVYIAYLFKPRENREPAETARSWIYFLISAALALMVWKVSGIFDLSFASGMTSVRHEEFAMNLNSFVNPMGTSRILPSLPTLYYGQLEGYAYLGAGTLLLMAISCFIVWKNRSSVMSSMKLYYPILAAAVLMALFALGPEITLGKTLLINLHSYGMPKFLYETFRAEGRFIWLLYYIIVFIALKIVENIQLKPIRAAYLVAFALLVQVWDISPLFMRLYSPLPGNEWLSVDQAKWKSILSGHKAINMYPPGRLSYEKQFDYRQFAYLAVQNKMSINTGYVTRGDAKKINEYIDRFSGDISKGIVEKDAVYIVAGPEKTMVLQRLGKYCGVSMVDGYTVCVKKR